MKGSKVLLIAVTVCVSLCCLCGVGGFFLFRSGMNVALQTLAKEYEEPAQFKSLMEAGKLDAAYAMTTDRFQEEIPLKEFKARKQEYLSAFKGIELRTPKRFDARASTAKDTVVTLEYADSTDTRYVRMKLIDVTGGTKIDSITFGKSEP